MALWGGGVPCEMRLHGNRGKEERRRKEHRKNFEIYLPTTLWFCGDEMLERRSSGASITSCDLRAGLRASYQPGKNLFLLVHSYMLGHTKKSGHLMRFLTVASSSGISN